MEILILLLQQKQKLTKTFFSNTPIYLHGV